MIIPVFALANAGIELSSDSLRDASTSPVTLGIVAGLVGGKTIGIAGAVWAANRAGIAPLPRATSMRHVVGAAAVAGIGFTVALFIAGLAYDDDALLIEAKVGILAASLLAAGVGAGILLRVPRNDRETDEAPTR